MSRQPTNLGFALLGLLHGQPMSGYDLRKVFEMTALGNYSSSPGAIYPALQRLEDLALVEGDVDDSMALRPRKVYRTTEKGRATLEEWLARGIEPEDVARHMDELMLRFAFHGILESDAATHRFLTTLHRACDAYVEELEAQRELFPPEAPLHSRLALEAGINQYRASARWARTALRQFKGDEI